MYIQPNSTVILLKGVPLDNNYTNTIYYASKSIQYENLSTGYTKRVFNELTYQRVNKFTIRLQIKSDLIYDYNYLMFKNTAYGDKWFYAFINSVDYINDATSEIKYEIDVMQTWMFDYSFQDCFIERQHTESDDLFEHYEPETVDYGDMKTINQYSGTIDYSTWDLVICTTPLGTDATLPLLKNGVVSCAEYYVCDDTSIDVSDFIHNVLPDAQQESVLSAYMFPDAFISKNSGSHLIDHGLETPVKYDSGVISIPQQIGDYVPKNKRLFSSPFMLVEVTDQCGNSQYYKPELFSSDISFEIIGKYIGSPEIMVTPKMYRGENKNYSESFTVNGFPMMAIGVDTYRAWLAQSGNYAYLNATGNMLQIGANMLSGKPIGVANGYLGLQYSINQFQVASNLPNKLSTTDTSSSLTCLKEKYPKFKIKSLTDVYVRQVDDYFTKYGYTIGRIGKPITNARPHWTYVKTNGCAIRGGVPIDDTKKICAIYDNGITFWKKGSEVGNYSLDNSPT